MTDLPVLVVDDSATMRFYHRAVLAEAGFTVCEAVNGFAALELALDVRFGALVVDVNMPVMDGLTFIEEFRRVDAHQGVGVVVVSTQSRSVDVDAARRCGADAYITKPAEPVVLVATVRRVIEVARARRAVEPVPWSGGVR